MYCFIVRVVIISIFILYSFLYFIICFVFFSFFVDIYVVVFLLLNIVIFYTTKFSSPHSLYRKKVIH